MATIDIKLKSYDELIFEITKLNTDKYLLEQENKQLKEELENIKDFNNKLQASKDRLDKDDYNLAHILTKLEEWLKEKQEDYKSSELYDDAFIIGCTLDKIQELKEKYK